MAARLLPPCGKRQRSAVCADDSHDMISRSAGPADGPSHRTHRRDAARRSLLLGGVDGGSWRARGAALSHYEPSIGEARARGAALSQYEPSIGEAGHAQGLAASRR